MNLFRKHWALIALAIITLFGFLLRLHNLDWQCLKVDELVTAWAAKQTSYDIIRWSLSIDYNPPLYYLIAHWSSMLFGEVSRFAIRFPALILGTLAIPISYLIGKEVRNETLGLLVAALVSFMFPFFYYSQDARAYPLVLFAFLGFAYFALRIHNGNSDHLTTISCGVFAALCLWSHYYSLVPIGIIGLYLLCFRKEFVTSIFVAAILVLPMGLLFDPSQLVTRTTPQIFNVFWLSPEQMSVILLNELFCWSWVVILPLVIYAVCICKRRILQLFALTGVVTAGLLIPLARLTATMPRYAILISPLILVVAFYPVAELIDKQSSIYKKIAIFSLTVFIIFIFNIQSIVAWNTFDTCPIMNGTR